MSLPAPQLIAPGPQFWPTLVRTLLKRAGKDLSSFRIIVPAYSHAQQLKQALAQQAKRAILAPRVNTLAGWLALQLPEQQLAEANSMRMIHLYEQLRQQAWLKKLFGARSNTDLLPLAQMLLNLADELSAVHIPDLMQEPALAELRWQQALAQLPVPSLNLLSDEANLVWTIWQSQLDEQDGLVRYFARLKKLAQTEQGPLVWISPELPDPIEMAFLQSYALKNTVLRFHLDWRASALPVQLSRAWAEVVEQERAPGLFDLLELEEEINPAALAHIKLCPAASLEREAEQGAQLILQWLAQGKQQIAVIAQDRVVARRMAALLARAQVQVADETGWKLSTTRAASAIAAWLEVVASNAETNCLLDLLKSPFFVLRVQELRDQAEMVMQIELALRRENVLAGWDEAVRAVQQTPLPVAAQDGPMLLRILRKQAQMYTGRRSLAAWVELCRASLRTMGMLHSLARDWAGRQVLQMLEQMSNAQLNQETVELSFIEWRSILSLQMETLPYVPKEQDKRVSMMPLNGARLRHFDAVLMLGCDADNLPSPAQETLFFANAVRRELNLATRESRQKQQMRDFAELLLANDEVVLSWQEFKDDEPNQISPWLQRMQLSLQIANLSKSSAEQAISHISIALPQQQLTSFACAMPHPSAPMLLPEQLSASGYKRLFACPYQFFAEKMLRLSDIDELSERPEKRDYGDWLHEILQKFHNALLEEPAQDRRSLLQAISEEKFTQEMEKSAVALEYYATWQSTMQTYLNWAEKHEESGWQYQQGEIKFERNLQWPGGQIMLKSRIDRIDRNQDGEIAVLDYKTTAAKTLMDRQKGGEDIQLPFYGLLASEMHAPVQMAAFVALEKKQTQTIAEKDIAQSQQDLQAHILHSMQALQQGVGLPANGIEAACQYCDVRGLCRKGAWQ